MTTETTQGATTAAGPRPVQVHSVYIKATPERIWQAITDPEWNGRYGYGAPSTFELQPGGAFRSVPGPGSPTRSPRTADPGSAG